MIELERTDFEKTKLDYKSYIWRLPKSRKYFLITSLHGDLDESRVAIERLCLHNTIEELCSQNYYFSTVVIDLSQLNSNSSDLSEILPEDSNTLASQVAIVIADQNLTDSNKSDYSYFSNLEECISQLAFQNRKYRFDGGNKITEPSKSFHFDTHLSEYVLEEVSVSCELWTWRKHSNDLYLLKFSGEYPTGSQGENEGKYIGMKIRELIRDFSPIGVVLDFSSLHYEWGDDIEIYPWRFMNLDKPLQFIFKEDQLRFFEFRFVKGENRISNTFSDARKKLEAMIES